MKNNYCLFVVVFFCQFYVVDDVHQNELFYNNEQRFSEISVSKHYIYTFCRIYCSIITMDSLPGQFPSDLYGFVTAFCVLAQRVHFSGNSLTFLAILSSTFNTQQTHIHKRAGKVDIAFCHNSFAFNVLHDTKTLAHRNPKSTATVSALFFVGRSARYVQCFPRYTDNDRTMDCSGSAKR